MNLIEVDPILFVKCRLCLGETGQYQIVPNVQMQIKYCFEIDVEPFDGLPQLVCKNCKSILSQYTGVKQIFQEKQKILKSKLSKNSSNVIIDNIIQQQQNSTSFAQGDIENKNKSQRIKKYKRKTKVPTEYSATKTTFKTTRTKASKTAWESSYTKYFVCRFCTNTFKDKKAFNNHIQKQCILYTKYSNINKTFCLVELNKIGTTSNIIGSSNRVACNKYNIIESSKATYYILYKSKSEESNVQYDLSDSNGSFLVDNNKHKRQCIITRTSTKSVDSEQKNAENSDYKKVIKVKKHEKDDTNDDKMTRIVTDIECVNKEDFDYKSTKCNVKMEDNASEKLVPEKSTIHDKMIVNIIASRSNKYMNSLNLFVGQNVKKRKEESSTKHNNIVNTENKVIYIKEFHTTELLRSVEQENLEVVWLPKINGKVQINTRSKENKNSCNIVWENITSLPNLQYVIEDFVLVFERISELEACVNKTSEDNALIQADLHVPSLPNLKYETEDFALVFERLSELEACINKNNDDKQSTQVIPQRQEKVTEREQEESITHLVNSKKDKMLKPKKSFNNDTIPSKVPIYVDKSGCKIIDDNTYLSNLLNKDRQETKLLNANPVANPKKLPKKNFCEQIYSNELKNDSEVIEQSNDKSNHILYMPYQISTGPLTPFNEDQVEVDRCNKVANETNRDNRNPQPTLPKIHCKPISELMSVMSSSEQNSSFGLAINNERQSQINSMMQTNDSNLVYLNNPQFTNLFPLPPSPRHQNFIYYPQRQNLNPVLNNSKLNTQAQGPQNLEHFELHYFDI